MDVYSTLKFVSPQAESNPLARFLMRRFNIGFKVVVFSIFLLALLIILVYGLFAIQSESLLTKALFSGYGMIACWAQYGAYQFNKSGRANWIVVFMTQQFPAKTSSPI